MRLRTTPRPGKTLVLFVLLLPGLLAWVGLTVDLGLVLSGHRQAQNAADAAATAAAMSLMRGNSQGTALSTANTFVQQYNGLSSAPALVQGQTFNVPPSQGPYAGNSQYVEVIVKNPVGTWFIQAAGAKSSQWVQARAVAGFPPTISGIGVAALDPNAIPGLSLSGNAKLTVTGKLLVNSHGGGYDQNDKPVNLGYGGDAVSTTGNATIQAPDVEVVGGVSSPSSIAFGSIIAM
jgi:Flp pilus assembly protein TadG